MAPEFENVYIREDPRGPEYGYFQVYYRRGDAEVIHSSGFRMAFNRPDDLAAWCRNLSRPGEPRLPPPPYNLPPPPPMPPVTMATDRTKRSLQYRAHLGPIIWLLEQCAQCTRFVRNIDVHNLECRILDDEKVLWPLLAPRYDRGGSTSRTIISLSADYRPVLTDIGGGLPEPKYIQYEPGEAERLAPYVIDRILAMMGPDI